METFVSELSGQHFSVDERITGRLVRPSIMQLIRHDYPDFDESKTLSLTELNRYKEKYITCYLDYESEKLSKREQQVLEAIRTRPDSVVNPDDEQDVQGLCRIDRLADRVASFGGSWTFIIIFLSFFLVWIVINTIWILNERVLDPYPFVLLNLILSYLSTLQAPVIMMSQNRHSARDRHRAKVDFLVNLRAELEIHALHEKLDHLILSQQQEMVENQQVQVDMLNDLRRQIEKIKIKD